MTDIATIGIHAAMISWPAQAVAILSIAALYWRAGFDLIWILAVLVAFVLFGPVAFILHTLALAQGVLEVRSQVYFSASQAWVFPILILPLVFGGWKSPRALASAPQKAE